MSSSVHFDNKGKDILIFGKRPAQGLDGTTLKAEAKYPINFTNKMKDLYKVYTIMKKTVSYLLMLQKYISVWQKIQK